MFDKLLARVSTLAASFSALLLPLSVSSVVNGSVLSLTTTGAGSVTIPAGFEWTNVTVQCWGAGGGGGFGGLYSYGATDMGGGGGGGGAYAAKAYAAPLAAGAYSFYVGGGGASSSGTNAQSGGSTIWNYLGAQDIIAGGGSGGGNVTNYASGGGGLVLAGTGNSGGGGGNGYFEMFSNCGGGGGGGSGGPSGQGGNGGNGSLSAGSAGTGYGAGGAGGIHSVGHNGSFPGGGGGGASGAIPGGSGANGEIVITYTQQAVPEPSTFALLSVTALVMLVSTWRHRRQRFAAIIAAIALMSASRLAEADVFNMPSGDTSLSFVTVGDPGNVADSTGYGAVPYKYQLGKYDVTLAQYTQFLNAVAATDTYGLYSSNLATSFSAEGIGRSGNSGGYHYAVIGTSSSAANMPVFGVSWGDAVRFCNWLQNGQPSGAEGNGTTEMGAYNLSGATSQAALMAVASPSHNGSSAPNYFLPTQNEWYKAAYYKTGGTNAGYWFYPMQSSVSPNNSLALSHSQSNEANFFNTSTNSYTDPTTSLTPVGTFSASPGPYGTYDMGGDVWQWNETDMGLGERGILGGSYSNAVPYLESTNPYNSNFPGSDAGGFRIASSVAVPEPCTLALLCGGVVGALSFVWRRSQ
jgi:formylglycine-generating enzyme required for sulfatase activity